MISSEFDRRPERLTDTRLDMAIPHSRTYDWSAGGLLNMMQDESGHCTAYQYDATGQLIGLRVPNYDHLAFSHDAGGRLTEKWFLNGTMARYDYNADDGVASVKRADGHDRKLKTLYPNPTTVNTSSATDYEQYGYDNNGNVISVRKRNGQGTNGVRHQLTRDFTVRFPQHHPP
jgi:uncharacterized protein RhaS with RHS repeats